MEKKSYLKFRRPNSVPSGGYAYVDPNNKHRIVEGTFQSLVTHVRRYRKANDFKIEDNLAEIIEDWICQRIPVDQTSAYEPNRDPVVTNATSATIVAITSHLLLLFKKNGRIQVSPEIAKERADTCRACPKNVSSIACASCQGITSWVHTRIKGSEENEHRLYICSPSAIMNIAQIYVPLEVIKQTMTTEQINTHDKNC